MKDKAAIKGIDWVFGAAKSSHYQGLVERCVRTFKTALRRSIGQQPVSFTTLQQVVKECVAFVNERPLAVHDKRDLEGNTITPSLLVFGRLLGSLPLGSSHKGEEKEKIPLLADMQRQRRILMTRFRKMWLADYLLELSAKKFITGRHPDVLEVDMVVLIREEGPLKRLEWRTGRVIEIIPGRDGLARRIKLKTARGEISRDISRIALLEGTPFAADQRGESSSTLTGEQAELGQSAKKGSANRRSSPQQGGPTQQAKGRSNGEQRR